MENIIENIKRQLEEDKDLTIERKIRLTKKLIELEDKQRSNRNWERIYKGLDDWEARRRARYYY